MNLLHGLTHNRYYVYAYKDASRGGEVFYVGKGCGKRAYSHLNRDDHHPLTYRIRKIQKLGQPPQIEFLCVDVDEELAFLVEMEAIALYGRKDLGKGSLLNLTDGGEGASGPLTPEMKQYRAEIMRGVNAAKRGQPLSSSHKANISAGTKGLPKSVETRQRMSGRVWTDEMKVNLSKARKGKGLGVKLSDEHKAKIAANCGRPCTEERRAKISAANKGRVFSEESLRRMSEGQKRRQQRLRDEKISR